MGIAENIKLLREHYEMTQNELGEIAGVSDKAVSTWEKGIKEPRMGAIQKMADHFHLLKSDIIEDGGINRHFYRPEMNTIAAHHDGEDWTEEELDEIERFKEFIRSKRENKG